jgi:hypothetical protein
MSIKAGDIVYLVWELRDGSRGQRIRKFWGIYATRAGAIVGAPGKGYEIEEYLVK